MVWDMASGTEGQVQSILPATSLHYPLLKNDIKNTIQTLLSFSHHLGPLKERLPQSLTRNYQQVAIKTKVQILFFSIATCQFI